MATKIWGKLCAKIVWVEPFGVPGPGFRLRCTPPPSYRRPQWWGSSSPSRWPSGGSPPWHQRPNQHQVRSLNWILRNFPLNPLFLRFSLMSYQLPLVFEILIDVISITPFINAGASLTLPCNVRTPFQEVSTVQFSNLADFYVYWTLISISKINPYHHKYRSSVICPTSFIRRGTQNTNSKEHCMCIKEKQNISWQSIFRNLSHAYTPFRYLCIS